MFVLNSKRLNDEDVEAAGTATLPVALNGVDLDDLLFRGKNRCIFFWMLLEFGKARFAAKFECLATVHRADALVHFI